MKRILLLLIVCVFYTSCNSDSSKSDKSDSYKSDKNQNLDYEKTRTGLYYKFYEENRGDTPELMDILDVTLSCLINDTAVIIPASRNLIPMMESMFIGDIFEGLKMMHKGDSASFIVRTDSTFYTLYRTQMPREYSVKDIMKINVRLNDFYPESELQQKEIEYMKNTFVEETMKAEDELHNYFKDNAIEPITTSTGLNYLKTKDGNGEKPQVGTLVKVHYTGKLLDGTVFDSSIARNEPIKFVLGIGQVISGWDEGIQMMSKGEKGVLYIPYYLAYGERGSDLIPPFATLVFEVELVDF